MSTLNKRSTVYLESELHKALKLKALETDCSISKLINDALRLQLSEDEDDLASFNLREKENSISFESFVKELKKSGKI